MQRSTYETLELDRPADQRVRRDDSTADLTPHLERIVRRALRRPDDCSPLACAVRQAVAQVETEPGLGYTFDNEVRIRQVARRVSALLTPDYRDPPGLDAHRETVSV